MEHLGYGIQNGMYLDKHIRTSKEPGFTGKA